MTRGGPMRFPRSFVALCLLLIASAARATSGEASTAGTTPHEVPAPTRATDPGTPKGGPSAHSPAPASAPGMIASGITALAAPPSASEPNAAPRSPKLRLPRTLLPESNRVSLVLDPGKETFTGRIEIAARVTEPARVFRLHAKDLTLRE